jgi:hypothetical protein
VTLSSEPDAELVGNGFMAIGGLLLLGAIAAVVRAQLRARRASWLRTNGIRLPATFIHAEPTGMLINRVRVYDLSLEVTGAQGPYRVVMTRPMLEHEIEGTLGTPRFARVNPSNCWELVLEE